MRSRRSLDRSRAVLAALWAVCIMTGGCMVGPNYARPADEQPAHFKSQADSEAAPDIARAWWQLFGDPELDPPICTEIGRTHVWTPVTIRDRMPASACKKKQS